MPGSKPWSAVIMLITSAPFFVSTEVAQVITLRRQPAGPVARAGMGASGV
jgi:hypothetical protein